MTGGLADAVRSACCVVSAAALVAGCGGAERARTSESPATPGVASGVPTIEFKTPSPVPTRSSRALDGLPDPHHIDQKDATAVSKAALTIMHTVDSTVDEGLRDARLRAARYLTDDYAATIEAEPVQFVPAEWRRHRVHLAVRLRLLERERGAPPDGPTDAYRQWQVTTTPKGRDGWRGEPHTMLAYVALTRSSARGSWRIADSRIVATG